MASMAHKIPTVEPQKLTAGDTAIWKKSLSDYPADEGWILSYALVKSGTDKVTFNSSASGTEHLVSVAATDTTGWVAGFYAYQAKVKKGTEEYTVGRGQIEILAEFEAAASGGIETRSVSRIALDKVNAWLTGTKSVDVAEYSIAGRSMK